MIPFATFILGCWLIATSVFLDYQKNIILISDLFCGALLILIGLVLRSRTSVIKSWVIAFIGVWLNFAPLVFWTHSSAVYLNNSIAGVAAIGLFFLSPIFPAQVPNSGPTVPPGWSYNPSSFAQRIPVLFLAFICWMISRYLASYQLGYITSVWDPFFNPGTVDVLTSSVSKAFPVSDAGLGAFAYSIETLSGFGSERRWRTQPWLVILFGLLTIPLALTSIVLIMLQPVIVGAWCTLCLINAFLMLIPIAFAMDEVMATLQFLRHSKEKSFLQLLFHGGTCPSATVDHRSPALDQSLWQLLKASAWGITLPYNLALTTLLGGWLMISPALFDPPKSGADLDHIIGALVIVVSMMSFSEVIRYTRWLNVLLAALLFAGTLLYDPQPLPQLIAALLIAALSIRKGPIREHTKYRA